MKDENFQVIKVEGFKETLKKWWWKAMFTIISQKYWITLISIFVLYQLMITKHTYDLVNTKGEVVSITSPYLNATDGGNYLQLIVVAFLAIRSLPVIIISAGEAIHKAKNSKELEKEKEV